MKLRERREAIRLRKQGKSLIELHARLDVSKSTLSLWLRDVPLSPQATARIREQSTRGQQRAHEALRRRTEVARAVAQFEAEHVLEKVDMGDAYVRAALLAAYYWCEGSKSDRDLVSFANSDPDVVRAFVTMLRQTFPIDESRFRIVVHLHPYHDAGVVLPFWSKVTTIPLRQFLKPYIKPHTAKRTRAGYQGCVHVRYYDVSVARTLLALGSVLNRRLGSIG